MLMIHPPLMWISAQICGILFDCFFDSKYLNNNGFYEMDDTSCSKKLKFLCIQK
jgi:hypothetical protein